MWEWNYFDDIICISCKDSTKRRENADKIFKKYKIPARYYIVEKHPNGSNHGCFESHINIFKEAYDKGHKKILIFEDDIVVSSSLTKQNVSECIKFIKENKWDLFYLGAVPDMRGFNRTKKTSYENIYQLKGICTHAYIVNENVIRRYRNLQYKNVPIDYLLRDDKRLKSFAFYPTFFYQETSYIKNFPQDMINTYFRFNEWYSYKINIPLNIMFSLILIVLVIVIKRIKIVIKMSTILLSIAIFILLILALYWEKKDYNRLEKRKKVKDIKNRKEREKEYQFYGTFNYKNNVQWRIIFIGSVISTMIIYCMLNDKIKFKTNYYFYIFITIFVVFHFITHFKTFHLYRPMANKVMSVDQVIL